MKAFFLGQSEVTYVGSKEGFTREFVEDLKEAWFRYLDWYWNKGGDKIKGVAHPKEFRVTTVQGEAGFDEEPQWIVFMTARRFALYDRSEKKFAEVNKADLKSSPKIKPEQLASLNGELTESK
ncbi:MAG: hypothetical protein ABIN18_29715 [Pseudomonadota bacterium]